MIFLVIPLLLFLLVPATEARASWVGLTTEELIEKADVILIGEIAGPVGEERIDSMPTWYTHWKVKVRYYLKGGQETAEFIVSTPGAKNKSVTTSIDYRLDQWGKTVLLFLYEREGIVEPISPQGVVNLKKTEFTPVQDEQTMGPSVLKEFTIVDAKNNDRKALEKYINDNTGITAPKTGAGNSSLFHNIITLSVLIFLLIMGAVFRFFRTNSKTV